MTVRDVFAGTIRRDDILLQSPRSQVYAAVAIMLALPQHYLDEGVVRGPIGPILEGLLRTGNRLKDEPGIRRHKYGKICCAAGLYKSASRRRGVKPITLTPPDELTALVVELGTTPAVMLFHAEAAIEMAAAKQRHDDMITWYAAKQAAVDATARDVLARIYTEGGNELAWAVYRALKSDLHVTW